MLKREHRLAKFNDVKRAYARGRSFFTPYLIIKYASTPVSWRFTVVVSAKVSKKAVVRNRLKRIIREAIRNNLADFRTGDYIITLKPAVANFENQQLREEFMKLLEKTRLAKLT